MKEFWLKVIPWNKKLVTSAIESGVDAIWVEEGYEEKVKELGLVNVISPKGDIKPGVDFEFVKIASKEDERRALEISKTKIVVVDAEDWRIIPLENLIAASENIFQVVRSVSEAEVAIGILERGVRGVLLETDDTSVIKQVGAIVKRGTMRLKLEEAEVIEVKPVGMGFRACVDTTDLMGVGEGMLVGDKSDFFFLVHSESIENPYVAPRPFRVNAGGVHAYILCADGRTKYLSEISTGDRVVVVNSSGDAREAVVGRSKVELRPLLLVKAICGGKEGTLILQNAETIRLTRSDGSPVSVVKLRSGDRVLVHITEAGRHFGMKEIS